MFRKEEKNKAGKIKSMYLGATLFTGVYSYVCVHTRVCVFMSMHRPEANADSLPPLLSTVLFLSLTQSTKCLLR